MDSPSGTRQDDPFQAFEEAGVSVAWASSMPYTALWLSEQRVLVLNARLPRDLLYEEARVLLREDPGVPRPSQHA